MIETSRSWRSEVAVVSGAASRTQDMGTLLAAGTLMRRRNAIASAEPDDADITGMTRSLDRRLLALNLKPVASFARSRADLKVA
jgi:hypothetical protein